MTAAAFVLDPLMDAADAEAMVQLCQDFGGYGLYVTERSDADFAPELAQRYDAAANYVRTGGRFGRREAAATLALRTNYLRESYAYGDERFAPGIETFLHHEALLDAARRLYDRPVVEPAIAYANILLPGQELAVHTDVPEFRGANRKLFPQWLMVVMHHSGLFERWRMPIATGIAYFSPESAGVARGRRAGLLAARRRGRCGGAPDPAQHGHRPRHRLGLPRRRPGRSGRRRSLRGRAPATCSTTTARRGCCGPSPDRTSS